MADLARVILERRAREAGTPFFLVVEIESTDNMANANNAIGALRALGRADEVIGSAAAWAEGRGDALVFVAADSDAGGLQAVGPAPVQEDGRVTGLTGNPTDREIDHQLFAFDGVEGRATRPFVTRPDRAGRTMAFAIGWTGGLDVAGGVVARATGYNSELLQTAYHGTIDNTDVYALIYRTLFARLPDGESERPTRR
jgi:alkaline phosphatase